MLMFFGAKKDIFNLYCALFIEGFFFVNINYKNQEKPEPEFEYWNISHFLIHEYHIQAICLQAFIVALQ